MKGQIHRFISVIAIVLIFSTLFAACRPSMKLVDVIYDQDSEIIDDKMTLIDPNKLSKEQLDSIPERQYDKNNDDKRDKQKELPVQGEDDSNLEAKQTENDKNATSKTKSSSGSKGVSDATKNNTNSTASQSINTYKHIFDPNSGLGSIPENIDKVVAVGPAAPFIIMLGGASRLVGSSADLLENSLARSVFANKKISSVSELWSGNGSSGISDANFQALLAIKPGACFEISGQNTFSNAQVKALGENGIYYIVLPAFNSTSNIKLAVQIMGKVLGNRSSQGGTNAPSIAGEYATYIENVISNVSSKTDRVTYYDGVGYVNFDNDRYTNGRKSVGASTKYSLDGFFSVFVADWESSTAYSLNSNVYAPISGHGAAVSYSGYSWSTLTYYMSLAGVLNTAVAPYEGEKTEGVKRWYISPLKPTSRTLNFTGGSSTKIEDYSLTQFGIDTGGNASSVTRAPSLGAAKFPAVIAASNSIKDSILADKNSPLNTMWKVYPVVTATSGSASDFGFLDNNGQVIRSTIVGDYDIYVLPSGVSDWSNGSPESILSVYWFGEKYNNLYSLDEMKSHIKEFYSKFYGYSLSNLQVEAIYNGK